MKTQRSRQNWFAILGVFVAVCLFTFLVQKFNGAKEVDAANMAGFDAGYIISDYQMGNYGSMNESQIQAFLKSKVNCNDTATWQTGNNVGHLSETAPYSWHVEGGHYVCMADENFNGESAAHIIWQAAQDYRINPQVLIVLLQKEQGLVTDSFPNSVQYRSAMGYGCPDTAACSSKYYGFKNQVRNAAALFREVLDGGWTNYPLGNNYVRYNPNAGCGGSTVNIRSRATSALYRYTPYQPNAAALSSSYGGGDGCSAYGNRNFYSYFEDWFGNIKWDGWPSSDVINASLNNVSNPGTDVGVQYRTYLEHYGWRNWTDGAKASGSVGHSVQVEALQLKLKDSSLGGIEYRTHVADVGWMEYVKDGAMAGTTETSKQVEAVQIRLTGDIARRYDVYYRAHVANKGWMDWVKNDEVAGTTGQSLQVEAIQVRIVKKDLGLGPDYMVHAQDYGWMNWVKGVKVAGTTGQSKRLEAIEIKLPSELSGKGDISYQVHAQDYGWMDWVKNGESAGTTGQSKRLEAVQIELVKK